MVELPPVKLMVRVFRSAASNNVLFSGVDYSYMNRYNSDLVYLVHI